MFTDPADVKGAADPTEEAGPKLWILVVGASPERGPGGRLHLTHPTHLGTEMRSFQVDGHPVSLEDVLQGVGDLLPQPLLHGEAPGEEAHQPGQLGDADDLLVRDVPAPKLPAR